MAECFLVEVDGYGAFRMDSGEKLAYALERSGVDISHRCGGQARCTTCRVKFHTPEPSMGETERQSLDEDGVLGQFRLSCQIRVDRDMRIEVLMPVRDAEWTDPGVELEP